MENKHYSELLVELECPICTNYMTPPIRQCVTGHSFCQACRKKLPKCALCQGKFTESRNLTLENLATKMRYPCINKQSGCNLILANNEREAHELQCSFRGYKCPMEKCGWVGKLEKIAEHWKSKKMMSKPYQANNICHTKIKSESYYVNIVQAYNKVFWYKCKLSNKKIHWALQLVGNSSEAENYFYEIEIVKSNRTKRKMLFSDYCQSIDVENERLFDGNSCISVSSDMINHYLSDYQILVYYMRVYVISVNQNEPQQPTVSNVQKQRDRSKSSGSHNRNKYYNVKKDENNKQK